ncbi:MAG: ABC transporter ATP-binding protein [Defluviitaleaceae bacterium]|nr:ABC transporter ATP-binding protein [Defluviitaleaceae bacterium]MCL2239878.1 ABC transporter ATP-binding protein [Defluviitaleaceae bacterium]
MNMLEIEGLGKSFGHGRGKIAAVADVSLAVGTGEFVGFVGPNGSGKTTTLKIIANLIWPDVGKISINGYDLFKQRKSALGCLAGIVENPGLFSGLTGMAHLDFIRGMRKVKKSRMDECIELSGLGKHLRRKAQEYSLGMKQRLALAMCLMTDPKLLILDEPTNGLDPTGVLELREMLAIMKNEGKVSLLFSSHMLGEVEKLADRIVYIRRGHIIKEQGSMEANATYFLLDTSDNPKAMEALAPYGAVIFTDGRIKLTLGTTPLDAVIEAVRTQGVAITDIQKRTYDLEAVYEELYRGGTPVVGVE